MRIFQQKDNNIIVSPEVLTIPEFSAIWKADKTKDKVEAFKAFTYIYHTVDYNSPYSNYPKDKKDESIKQDMLGDPEYKVSDKVYRRMDSLVDSSDYNAFIESATNIMRDLVNEGFEVKDIFYYLYTRLTAEV